MRASAPTAAPVRLVAPLAKTPVPKATFGQATFGQATFCKEPAFSTALKRAAAAVILFSTVAFNWLLAFTNTRLMGISETHVILFELLLVASATLLVIDRRVDFYLILIALFGYFALMSGLEGYVDVKPLRDVLLPVVFFYLGMRALTLGMMDRIVAATIIAALLLTFWEMMALDHYLQFVNVRGYYLARGTLSLEDLWDGKSVGLMINGERYMERDLFSFLGSHRVSGLFLEPVSVGNYGAICMTWIAVRCWGRPLKALLYLAPVIFMMLCADARFGLYVGLLVLALLPFARIIPAISLIAIAPVIAISLAIYGAHNVGALWDNSLGGRIVLSSQVLAQMSWQTILGFGPHSHLIADSGYGYVLANQGLLCALALWAALFLLPTAQNISFKRFRLFLVIYISLILIISGSLFSLKTAGLLWAMAGVLFWHARDTVGYPVARKPADNRPRFSHAAALRTG